MQRRRAIAPVVSSSIRVEQLPQQRGSSTARRRWRRPSARPRAAARPSSVAADDAAQRRRQPQLLVVAAARVEAHDQAGRADARGAGARCRRAGRSCRSPRTPRSPSTQRACGMPWSLQRAERGQRGEDRVAVVGAAAAVEPVALASPASTGPRPSLQPAISGCLSRWPYSSTVSPSRAVPGTSMKITGRAARRAGRPRASRPRAGDRRAQPASSSTALVHVAVLCATAGSNIGDLFGIRMYSMRVGTMELLKRSSTQGRAASVSMAGSLPPTCPKRRGAAETWPSYTGGWPRV